MKIYCVQLEIEWENKAANHEKVRKLLTKINNSSVPSSRSFIKPRWKAPLNIMCGFPG